MKLDPYDYIPVTFHIKNKLKDSEFQAFLEFYN